MARTLRISGDGSYEGRAWLFLEKSVLQGESVVDTDLLNNISKRDRDQHGTSWSRYRRCLAESHDIPALSRLLEYAIFDTWT